VAKAFVLLTTADLCRDLGALEHAKLLYTQPKTSLDAWVMLPL